MSPFVLWWFRLERVHVRVSLSMLKLLHQPDSLEIEPFHVCICRHWIATIYLNFSSQREAHVVAESTPSYVSQGTQLFSCKKMQRGPHI